MTNKPRYSDIIYDTWLAHYVSNDGGDTQNGDDGNDSIDLELVTPKQIFNELDRYVIGQDETKKLISVAAFNRLLALRNHNLSIDNELYFEKNNMVMIGNTGCGKTHIMKSLSSIVELPVSIQDATSFTASGYVGKDIDKCIDDLYLQASKVIDEKYNRRNTSPLVRADNIKTLTKYGIIYVDEFDKVRSSGSGHKDVNGRAVQEAFLKLVEGKSVQTEGYYSAEEIDTSNILFIFGGAFHGLDKIIDKRVTNRSIGFNQAVDRPKSDAAFLSQANIDDFTKYGIIPEILGRLSSLTALEPMSKDLLYKIFSEPKYSIMSQITNEFKSFGIDLRFSQCAIEMIVEEAYKLKLGARGLRGVCQRLLKPLFFELPSVRTDKSIVVTRRMIEQTWSDYDV